jgi:hypothetical protein
MDIARVCLPSQLLVEATGTLHATSRQRDGLSADRLGKARALDALAQSEYYGAVPVPLAHYKRAGQAPVDPQHPDHARRS